MKELEVLLAVGRMAGAALLATMVGCAGPPKPGWSIPEGVAVKSIKGYPLAYSTHGSGPVVVFLPGVLTDYRVWEQALKSWETDYQVIAISPRHFYPEKWDGKGADFTIRQHAKDVDDFIEGLGRPVYLVGWSYGGHIAYEAAFSRPDLIRKLVLVEAPLDSLVAAADEGANSVRIQRAATAANFFEAGDVDGGLEFALDAINGPGVWANAPEMSRRMLRDNAWTVVRIGREEAEPVTCARFGSLKMPVMLVQGQLTTPRFKKIVAEQSRCLPQASVITTPNARHPSPMINPEAFRESVTAFLGS